MQRKRWTWAYLCRVTDKHKKCKVPASLATRATTMPRKQSRLMMLLVFVEEEDTYFKWKSLLILIARVDNGVVRRAFRSLFIP